MAMFTGTVPSAVRRLGKVPFIFPDRYNIAGLGVGIKQENCLASLQLLSDLRYFTRQRYISSTVLSAFPGSVFFYQPGERI